nr:immunoglobulin heavy chain junction region [Macaca mulatta]MOY26243.1 immunoglobulin heavy chain junction region [Macaca mulatta]
CARLGFGVVPDVW